MRRAAKRDRLIRKAFALLTASSLLLLCLYLIYSNSLFLLLFRTASPYGQTLTQDRLSIAASSLKQAERNGIKADFYTLKLALPFSLATDGCEFIYAQATYVMPQSRIVQTTASYRYPALQYLVPFRYDLKNKRCEAKSLFINQQAIPQQVNIQLFKVTVTSTQILETPLNKTISLEPKRNNEKLEIRLVKSNLSSAALTRQTSRVPSFSTNLQDHDFQLISSPYDDLKTRILNEIQETIRRCEAGQDCRSITAAIAHIQDYDILLALDRANQAGSHVEIITNLINTMGGEQSDKKPFKDLSITPTIWLRHNPFLMRQAEQFPMHTKFIIFGNDLVISSNPNYNFEQYYASRELSIAYTAPTVIAMFQELASMLRTSLFYPLQINLQDNFWLLFNADRPRGYSASTRKPFLSIETNEGISGSAYGLVFKLLADHSEEQLRLAMSPLTFTCAHYSHRFCLKELLRDRANHQRLTLLLNSNFYRRGLPVSDNSQELLPQFGPIKDLFRESPDRLHLLSRRDRNYSSHHERLALLGENWTILGSANWSRPSSLNTLEVFNNKNLNQRLSQEWSTFDEPYFVALNPEKQECEFIFEKDLLITREPPLKEFSSIDILNEYRLRSGDNLAAPADLAVMQPDGDKAENVRGLNMNFILDKIASPSSYFCIINQNSGKSTIVRAQALKSTQSE